MSNPWRRFRGLSRRLQLVALIGLVFLAVVALASASDSSENDSAASPSTSTTEARSIDPSTSPTTASTTTTTAPEEQPASPVSSLDGSLPETTNGIAAEPRRELSPGAIDPRVTQANIDSTICVSGYTATVRPSTSYTSKVKLQQLANYGYDQTASRFELDHVVPLELGGAPFAVDNLWPEPLERSGLVPDGWGAETKDQFENYLHRAVCAHRVLLADAQRQMASHWIAAAEAAGLPAGSAATSTTTTVSSSP